MRKFRLNASEAFLCASSYDYYYIHGIFWHLHFIRFWWRTKWHYGRWDDIKEKQQIPEPESYLVHRAEKKTIVLAAHLPISSFCQKNEQFRRILSNGRRKSVEQQKKLCAASAMSKRLCDVENWKWQSVRKLHTQHIWRCSVLPSNFARVIALWF